MTSSQVQVSETPPMSQQDLEGLKDENGLYAGKFKTVEDLANSYKELEGKLGSVQKKIKYLNQQKKLQEYQKGMKNTIKKMEL